MPFVLKHKQTSYIYTCTLVNNYNIAFYGTKFWEDQAEAEQEAPALFAAAQLEADDWEIIELDEHKLKLLNVKLGNNPQRRVTYGEDGVITVHTQ